MKRLIAVFLAAMLLALASVPAMASVAQIDGTVDLTNSMHNNTYNIDISGDYDGDFTITELKATSASYKKMKAELKSTAKILGAYEMKLDGEYKDRLRIQFDVGTKNQGKIITVLYLSEGEVKSYSVKANMAGKATITTKTLSSYMVVLGQVTLSANPSDAAPETGDRDPAGMAAAISVGVLCLVGVAAIARKKGGMKPM